MRHHSRFGARLVFAAAAGLALGPLLVGCSPSAAPQADRQVGATLQAAADSDFMSAPTPVTFSVDEVASGRLLDLAGESIVTGPLRANGGLTIVDGQITAAVITVNASPLPEVRFSLTEPVQLRRELTGTDAFPAIGTLVFGSTERHDTEILLTPDLSRAGGEVTATMELPEGFLPHQDVAAGSLEIRVSVRPAE